MFRFPIKSIAASAFFLLTSTVAFAHTHPVTLSPVADATVAAPADITIHFSGDLEPKFSSITVINATGHVVNAEQSKVPSGDAKVLEVTLPTLPAGIYTVDWVAVSVDSHRSQGEYKFTVK